MSALTARHRDVAINLAQAPNPSHQHCAQEQLPGARGAPAVKWGFALSLCIESAGAVLLRRRPTLAGLNPRRRGAVH